MPTISSYTPDIVVPNYRTTNFDSTLEYQVAAYNQQNYDRVLNTVRNLQSQALNIQMLNAEGKERLDSYNKMIGEKLSGDLGDLSKIEVQNEIANVFQTIAGDTQLINASKLSGEYQKQIDNIESFRASGRKDRGYNSINETVFKEWDGGLYDFMNSSLSKVNSPTFKPVKYTPFKELDTKLLNIAKTLHQNTFIQEGKGSEGYLVHKELEEVSPDRIREMMMTQFDQEDLEQLDVMAKYEVIKHRKLNTIPEFHQKYNLFADNEIRRTQGMSDQKRQQAEYYQSLINNDKTPAEDKVKYTELVTKLTEESKLYGDKAFQLTNSKKTLEDFEKMSNDELLNYASAIQWHTKVNGLADALSWKKEVETYKLDQVWKVNKEIDAMKWREDLRAKTRMDVESMRKVKAVEGPQFTGPMDVVKNTQSFYESYKTLASESEKYGKLTDRVITSPSFNPNQLLDPSFLSSNKDNYEVKMWDVFSHENPTLAIKNGQPQLEAFKLWMADKEANPNGITAQYVHEFNRNKTVSDWHDKTLEDINKLTREKVNLYDKLEGYPKYKADGTPLTKAEYDAGVPAYLGVPFGQGFKLVSIEDALKEVTDFNIKSKDYVNIQSSSMGMSRTPAPTSYITQDIGLYQTLNRIQDEIGKVNAQLETEMVSRLPQIFQQPLVEAVNDEAKLIYYPDVVGSAKNVNNANAQFGISMDDIAFIRPPVTGNKGQFQLKPTLSENYGELGWQLPDAVDPTKMIPIIPGGTYSFFTNKPYRPYDVLLNEIVKDMPIKEGYKGYTIEVSRSKTTGNTYMKVLDPKGNVFDSAETSQQVDVSTAIKAARLKIDTVKK